jgi:hypothetical protein
MARIPASVTILCVGALLVRPPRATCNNVLVTRPLQQDICWSRYFKLIPGLAAAETRTPAGLRTFEPPQELCRDSAPGPPRAGHPAISPCLERIDAGPNRARATPGTSQRCGRSKISTGSDHGIITSPTRPFRRDRQAHRAVADRDGMSSAARGPPRGARLTVRLRGRRSLYSSMDCGRGFA